MGSRPFDAEGGWARLADDYARDLAELAADLVDQSLARGRIRFMAGLAFDQKRFDSGSGAADHPLGAAIEQLLTRFAGHVPRRGEDVVGRIGRRTPREGLDEPQRMANARKPRYRLCIRKGRFVRHWLSEQVKHGLGGTPPRLRKYESERA